MKKLTLSLLTCLIFLSPNVVMGETMDDLVKRDGLYYKKFSDTPFTGKVAGRHNGKINNGKWDGPFVIYHQNGQLSAKGDYKKGEPEGPWVTYYSNGQLWLKGTYQNGDQEGPWVEYHKNGQLSYKGDYKNGQKNGSWVNYWSNGQLFFKGDYKNYKREGRWVGYYKDGTIKKEWTGTFKNGKKISD